MIKVNARNLKAKLDRWAELLADASVVVEHTSEAQAEVAITLVGEGFDRQRDPYGRRWKKKQRPDGRKILHGETTRLRNGWHVEKATARSWRIAPSVEYAGYHQEPRNGSRPQRAMVPTSEKGLPKTWARELRAVALAEMHGHFGEAADGSKPAVKKRTKGSKTAADVAVPSRKPANDNAGARKSDRRSGSRGTSFGGLIRKLQRLRALARKAGVVD